MRPKQERECSEAPKLSNELAQHIDENIDEREHTNGQCEVRQSDSPGARRLVIGSNCAAADDNGEYKKAGNNVQTVV
jgi:hypothetical protein